MRSDFVEDLGTIYVHFVRFPTFNKEIRLNKTSNFEGEFLYVKHLNFNNSLEISSPVMFQCFKLYYFPLT